MLELELNIAIFAFISTGATFKLLKAFWTTRFLVLSFFHEMQEKKSLPLVFHNPLIYLLMHKLLTRSSKLKTRFALWFQTNLNLDSN